MRVGLIARADSRGLGVQTKSFHDEMHPAKTMVVDCPSANPLPLRHDWYPDATWIHGLPTADDFQVWLQDLDVVYTAETGYGQALWAEAERVGVKTVLHLNYEFLDLNDRPTLWAAPSIWHYDDIPFRNKVLLPVPIDTHPTDAPMAGRRFLHVIGRPAIHDRNGTEDLLLSLQYVESSISVTLTCQDPNYVPVLLSQYRIPDHVEIQQLSGDVTNSRDLYRNQDVLIMPRRFGGLCLPVNEALGCGMPVVMPNISPNNQWLPEDWLTPASKVREFRAKTLIEVFGTRPEVLASRIDRFAQDTTFFVRAQQEARALAEGLSWETQRAVYQQVLEMCEVAI